MEDPSRFKEKDDVTAVSGTPSKSKILKRRAVSSACLPCRKRKSKCDGGGPPCSTCTAVYRTECFYNQDNDHRRTGALKRAIQSCYQTKDVLEIIVASLRALPELDAIRLLHSIRTNDDNEGIAALLQTDVGSPIVSRTLEPDFVRNSTSHSGGRPHSDVALRGLSLKSLRSRLDGEDRPLEMRITHRDLIYWFRTTPDLNFIEHLLNLYFTWVHPFYHPFCQDRFLNDFKRGKTGHCSALLVHVLCAFGCHYSDQLAARADPDNPMSAGDHFFIKAKQLLNLEEKPSLTKVQALGVMSLRETSHGRESNGYQYMGRCLRVAVEMGLHLSAVSSKLHPADFEARKVTFWSVFNIETMISIRTSRPTQLPRAAADVEKPAVSERSESQTWRSYQGVNTDMDLSVEQPGPCMSFVHCFIALSEIASDMVNTFYATREKFTIRRLSTTYEAFRDWYRRLPQQFRLEQTSLPHVVVLHMYYHACVLHLFRPYLKLDLQPAGLSPRDTCTFCANEISALTDTLRVTYGLRRVCLPVVGFLLLASTIHLLNLPFETSRRHLCQAINDMRTMSTNHMFAARCVNRIRFLARRWQIELPEDARFMLTVHPNE